MNALMLAAVVGKTLATQLLYSAARWDVVKLLVRPHCADQLDKSINCQQ
jgi:hypothetical protein